MNRHKSLLILPSLALSLILLGSCQSRTAQKALPPSSPTVIATSFPSLVARKVTETPVPVTPSETPTPAYTPTPGILPTASLSDLPYPTLPDLSGNPGDYRLATPAPDQLLALITAARQQQLLVNGMDAAGEKDQQQTGRWDGMAGGVSAEVSAFVDAVEGAFLRAYPTALPDPALVFQDPYAKWWTAYPDLRPYPPRYVAGAFLSWLNQNGQQVEAENTLSLSTFSLQPYPAELDGTPGQEWIFCIWTPDMDYRYNGLALWQAVDELPGPKYVPLGAPVLAQPYLYPTTYQVTDLTGDDRTDLIVQGEGWGFDMVRNDFIVYQWTPTGFKQMSQFSLLKDELAQEAGGEPDIKFFPETPPALRLVKDTNHVWGCVYKTVDVYRWPGGMEQRAETNTMDPNSPDCLLARATRMYSGSDTSIDASQRLFERALVGFDPRDPKDQAKIAFARYHLAIIAAVRGNDSAARLHMLNVIQGFADDAPTAKYLDEKLTPLLAGPKLKAMDLCSLGYSAPREVFSAWWSGLNYPGNLGGPSPEDICYPSGLMEWAVQALPVDLNGSPGPLLTSAGLAVQSAQFLQFPDLKQPVWLALIDARPDDQWLIGSLPTETGVQWKVLADFYTTIGPPTWLNADVTGDGAADLAVAFPSHAAQDCKAGEEGYQVFIAGRVAVHQNVYASSTIDACQPAGQPLDLKALMADRDGDGLSDRLMQELETESSREGALELPDWPKNTPVWYTSADVSAMSRSLMDHEDELLTALYHNGNPSETRTCLLALRQALRPAPPGRNVRQQIDYLVALSYELEGKDEEAVQRYLDVAKESPQTLWSSLAAVKIAKK